MSESMYKATIRKDGNIKDIKIEDMTDEIYGQYKEYLFCENRSCNARIIYVGSKTGKNRPYFKTADYIKGENQEIIEQHSDECSHIVERKEGVSFKPKEDASIVMNVSKEHIKGSLKRASRLLKVEDGTLTVSTGKRKHTKGATKKIKKDDTVTRAGAVNLKNLNSEEEESLKEPRIPHRNMENIGDRDYGKSIIIRGEVQDVILESESENKYSYILLKSKEGKLTRILFGEYYKVHNEVQYNQIKFYKKYVRDLKQQGKKIRVVCAGEVMEDEFKFSIIVYDHEYIVINDLSHYEIINNYIVK